ncbi:MAG: hypothetical protein A2900_03525 [Candidatus Chisholmbacteria bacterium RIFCSPLOWO2_01_FULL_50_28]|uniref:Uncharacterized protein n=1 Tax=Candidatus Chisholmbacteria bacterium RIFCSPHIGHO2_01_FULL_52_32 TaxID=1797591 RepID=A0A1G1VSV1_9BACT|nr:MAG: hypothetical protein A2786_03220 [Candidatus Chisholmbacteria bacterium RIFCSPHIGHO2_01_FULL_52_32]OGY20146.1 MAG: hypothetical protein A2900_03525 [Candidatus Chisholmbacteria bacterium RIFCSPLOWO2_01_FULL_50_28]
MFLRFLKNLWAVLSRVLRAFGSVQIAILLSLFYYVILGPFAIGYKLVRGFGSAAKYPRTFWIPRKTPSVTQEFLKRQF